MSNTWALKQGTFTAIAQPDTKIRDDPDFQVARAIGSPTLIKSSGTQPAPKELGVLFLNPSLIN
jgi:hypothetical protein